MIILFFFSFNISGCAHINKTLREKFSKKKQDVSEKTQPIIPLQEEETYPNEVSYKLHYAYWDAWMTDLINYLGANKKRDTANCRRAVENLEKMSTFLKEEKADQLKPYFEELTALNKVIRSENLSSESNKRKFERHLREICDEVKIDFSIEKMGGEWIKPNIK